MKMQLQTYHFQIAVKEVKDLGQEGVEIEGYASTPDLDRYKDIVEPAAFSNALTMFMKNPSLLRSHDPDRPAGKITEARVTDRGLWVKAIVTEEETKKDVLEDRFRAFSIGYIPLESSLQHEDGSPFNAEVDSPWDRDMVRVIKKLDLIEISIVSTPANGNALFTIARSVKQYFNQLVTKSMKIKDTAGTAGEEEVIPTETPEEKEKREAEEAEAKKNADEEAEAEATKKKEEEDAAAAEEQRKLDEEAAKGKPEGEAPEEEIEKGAETAPADGGEAGDGEEPKAEIEPEATPAAAPEAVEAIGVDEETAKSLPSLVKAGLVKEVKDAGAIKLEKSVVNLISKLTDAYLEEVKKNKTLEDKLSVIPEKRALAIHGQFEEKTPEEAKKENSAWFKGLFGQN